MCGYGYGNGKEKKSGKLKPLPLLRRLTLNILYGLCYPPITTIRLTVNDALEIIT